MMTDAEIHRALVSHALCQEWTGPGSDLSDVSLRKMLEVEDAVEKEGQQMFVAARAIAAIYVAFSYQADEAKEARPIVVCNQQAVFVVKPVV